MKNDIDVLIGLGFKPESFLRKGGAGSVCLFVIINPLQKQEIQFFSL